MSKAIRLKQARERAGLTLEQVAERAGTTVSTVWRIEDGRRRLTMEWIERLSRAIGCSPADLLPNVRPDPNTAPVSQYLGADERALPFDMGPADESIDLPFKTDGWKGIRIATNDLWPRYERGDVILYRPNEADPPGAHLGKECVVGTRAGTTYIKRLLPGTQPGTFRLTSHRSPDDIDNVLVSWAAPVIWVKRVRQ